MAASGAADVDVAQTAAARDEQEDRERERDGSDEQAAGAEIARSCPGARNLVGQTGFGDLVALGRAQDFAAMQTLIDRGQELLKAKP